MLSLDWNKIPTIQQGKTTEGILIGPQIRELLRKGNFKIKLSYAEERAVSLLYKCVVLFLKKLKLLADFSWMIYCEVSVDKLKRKNITMWNGFTIGVLMIWKKYKFYCKIYRYHLISDLNMLQQKRIGEKKIIMKTNAYILFITICRPTWIEYITHWSKTTKRIFFCKPVLCFEKIHKNTTEKFLNND